MTETLTQAWTKIQAALSTFIAALPAIIIGLIVFVIFHRVSKLIRNQFVSLLERSNRIKPIAPLLGRLLRGSIIAVGALVSMTIALPSFQPSELIQILGIGGVAIGFAFRDIFENFLAGLLILFTQPFGINDEIKLGDYEGVVQDIQIRATYLKTFDGRLAVIPNSELFKNSVLVDTAFKHRRSEYDVGIGYEDDIMRAQEIMLDVMKNTDGVLNYPAPDTIMMEMGDSAIILRVRWWTQPNRSTVLRTQNLVLRNIKNRLTEEGFNIPFPIRTVMFYDQSENRSANGTNSSNRIPISQSTDTQ